MSPLTKLFVVLLVLVSVILTAGVVTFVNKLEPLQTQLASTKSALTVKESQVGELESAVATLKGQLDTAQTQMDAQAQNFTNQIQTLRQTLATSDEALANAKRDNSVLVSANSAQSTALQLSEDTKNKREEQIVALRKDADERQRQVVDLNQRLNTLQSENAVLDRERRNLTEQLVDLRAKNDQMSKMLQDMGMTPAQIARADTTPGRFSAPAINGVIRSRRTIAGKDYATISIGSADQVAKGMEFKILDKETGQFLGILTVDVVDANEAMGRISADAGNLAQIGPGNVVKTQI